MNIKGKAALITGASQGIGRAIAIALAEAGVRVFVAARRRNMLEALARELPGDVVVCDLDLANIKSINELVEELNEDMDILVNCGGIYEATTMGTAEQGALDTLMQVNVLGPYELTRQLLPGIIARKGQVVFINSSIVRGGGPTTGHHAASAQALYAIADSLRAEVNPHGVRVLSIFPGRTATPRQKMIFSSECREYDPDSLLQPADIAATIIHSLSLPANAELTDIWIRPAKNFTTP